MNAVSDRQIGSVGSLAGRSIIVLVLALSLTTLFPAISQAKGAKASELKVVKSTSVDGGYGLPDEPRGILFDRSSRLFATGYVTVPGQGRNIWLAKYNPALHLQESALAAGPAGGDDEGYGIASAKGHLYVVGYMTEDGQDHNVWLGKFNKNLDLEKQVTVNGSANSTDEGYGIIADKAGNIYVAGTVTETGQGYNILVAKYDGDLNLLKSITIDGPVSDTDKGRSLAFDSNGNLFVSGSVTQALTGLDIWLGKFDADLNLLKQVAVAGPTSGEDQGYGIVCDAKDNLYVTGAMSEAGQGLDIWLAKYDTELNQINSTTINGPANGDDAAYTLALDKYGYVYQTGVYTENGGDSNVWVAMFGGDLSLKDYTTYSGPGKQYDTGFGITKGLGRDVYVSASVANSSGDVNMEFFRYRVFHFVKPKKVK